MNYKIVAISLAALVVALAIAGCPRADDPIVAPGEGAAAGQGAPVAVEAAPPAAEPVAAEPAPDAARPPKMVRRAVVTSVSVARVEAERAEDGSGAEVAAKAPVAIEIAAEEWPARALDPVLHVGDLVFRHYTFPRVNVLRYVAADAALLPADAAAWIQYGDDAASRVDVAEGLEVPR